MGKIKFSKDEIYKVVTAKMCAMQVEAESGYDSDYSDFVYDDDLINKINSLSDSDSEKFDKSVSKCAKLFIKDTDEFDDMSSEDFDTDEEFLEEHDSAAKDLMNDIYDNFSDKFKED